MSDKKNGERRGGGGGARASAFVRDPKSASKINVNLSYIIVQRGNPTKQNVILDFKNSISNTKHRGLLADKTLLLPQSQPWERYDTHAA